MERFSVLLYLDIDSSKLRSKMATPFVSNIAVFIIGMYTKTSLTQWTIHWISKILASVAISLVWPSNGLPSCRNGTIEYIRFDDFREDGHQPAIIIKLSSYPHEHYTDNLMGFMQPILHAFNFGSEVELRTTTCDGDNSGFGAFVLYPPQKSSKKSKKKSGKHWTECNTAEVIFVSGYTITWFIFTVSQLKFSERNGL